VSERICLNKEEQVFLMEMLEMNNPVDACEKFAMLMVDEKADPTELQQYLKKIMKKMEKK
jgi:hypothetical protein